MSDDTAARKAATLATSFEGYSASVYWDPYGKVWTGGFGSTRGPDGQPLTGASPDLSRDQWLMLLERDMRAAFATIQADVRVPLTDSEEAALADFIYNVGSGNFAASTLLKMLNDGEYEGAAQQFARWDRSGGQVLAGLVRRRAAEAAEFTQKGTTA